MAMEVRCGQCYGILLIETPGVVVACPHCGVHLSFPGTEAETNPDPALEPPDVTNTDTPYSFKLPSEFSKREPIVEPTLNLPKEPNTSAVTHQPVSQPTVSPPVVSHPVVTHHSPVLYPAAPHPAVSQPVASQPVASQPTASQPTASYPVASQPTASYPVASQPTVSQPTVSHPTLSQPVASQPVISPPSQSQPGPDFSWMSTSEGAHTSSTPPSAPFAGLGSASANVASDARGFSSPPVSTGEAKAVEPTVSTGYSFSTPQIPIKSPPADHFEIGTTGNFPATPQFDPSTRKLPANSNESTINDVVDPSVFVAPSATRSPAAKDRGSCLVLLLLIVGSYASLITIYAAYLTLRGRTHQLESLPDLKTVQQQGGRAVVPRPENELPQGHELKIGQSQRYGNIRVTPLRVTRGPIKFVHFTNRPDNERAPSEDVLKLWLKFENVSGEQTITPIDTTLMYFQRGHSPVISYNVIFRQADRKKKDGLFFYNFDRLPPESEWQIVGQDANRALLPHEDYETFIPSQENVEILTGEMTWRVHFRKGYGPQTGNGVTTLIDVRFDSKDIEPDAT